ncbi:MAG: tmk [Pseudomonadota bacterium]|jgi:dTMP kinase
MSGFFLTIEGIDGAGKSTHLPFIAERLRDMGRQVVMTREPGGTAFGEKLRAIALNEDMASHTEMLIMFASRREHCERLIWPAIQKGQTVVCDRFTDATVAYQGHGRGLGADTVRALANWTHPNFKPNLTLWFDTPVDMALARLDAHRAAPDRFEREKAMFFEKVRAGYEHICTAEPQRVHRIDSSVPLAEVEQQIVTVLGKFFHAPAQQLSLF